MTDLHTMLFKELLIQAIKKRHIGEPPLRHVTGSASFFVGFSAMGAEATHTHRTISDITVVIHRLGQCDRRWALAWAVESAPIMADLGWSSSEAGEKTLCPRI